MKKRYAVLLTFVALLIIACGKKPQEETLTPTAVIPKTLPNSIEIKHKGLAKTYAITGIGIKDENKMAIINNVSAHVGEEIDPDVFIEDITLTYVVILYGNKEYLLRPQSIQNELDLKADVE